MTVIIVLLLLILLFGSLGLFVAKIFLLAFLISILLSALTGYSGWRRSRL